MYFTAVCQSGEGHSGIARLTIRIMKLTTVLMIAACLQISARGLSQTVTIQEKNASLQKIFEDIRRQTGYQFFYIDETLRSASPVTLSVTNESLEKVLALCFRDQPLTYTISDKTIIVKRKAAGQTALGSPAAAPVDTAVKGRVADDMDQPLEGVSVTIVGSSTGTGTTGTTGTAGPADPAVAEQRQQLHVGAPDPAGSAGPAAHRNHAGADPAVTTRTAVTAVTAA